MLKDREKFESLRNALEELGEIQTITEERPGCYYASIDCGGSLIAKEFYIVDIGSGIISPIAKSYGTTVPEATGWLLYPYTDESAWHVVQYEVTRYKARLGLESVDELRSLAICNRELYPEYFGAYPIPSLSPWGYVIRSKELGEGVYWLETDNFTESLFIGFPNYDSLSSYATAIADKDEGNISSSTPMGCLFFTKGNACVPLFELYGELKEGSVNRDALMNAVIKYHPAYATEHNITELVDANYSSRLMDKSVGRYIENMVLASDEAGTDFVCF